MDGNGHHCFMGGNRLRKANTTCFISDMEPTFNIICVDAFVYICVCEIMKEVIRIDVMVNVDNLAGHRITMKTSF